MLLNLLLLACFANTIIIPHAEGRNNITNQFPFKEEFHIYKTYRDQKLVFHWTKVPETSALLKYCYETCASRDYRQKCNSSEQWSPAQCKPQTGGNSCKALTISKTFIGYVRVVVVDRNATSNNQDCKNEQCIEASKCNVSVISKLILLQFSLEFYSTFSEPLLNVTVNKTSAIVKANLVNPKLICQYEIEFSFSLEMDDSPVGNELVIRETGKKLPKISGNCSEENPLVTEQFMNLIPNKIYNLTVFYSIKSEDIYITKSDDAFWRFKTKSEEISDFNGFSYYLLVAIILPIFFLFVILIIAIYRYLRKIYGIKYELPDFLKKLQEDLDDYANEDENSFNAANELKEIADVYKPLPVPRASVELKSTELIHNNVNNETIEKEDEDENIPIFIGYIEKDNLITSCFDDKIMQNVSNDIDCTVKIHSSQTSLTSANIDENKRKQNEEVCNRLRPDLAAFREPSVEKFQNSFHNISGKVADQTVIEEFRKISAENDPYKQKHYYM